MKYYILIYFILVQYSNTFAFQRIKVCNLQSFRFNFNQKFISNHDNSNVDIYNNENRLMSLKLSDTVMPSFDEKFQFPLGKVAYSLFPFSPESMNRRKSLLTTIVENKIWTIDQIQGILNVNVPVRMTIISLKDGLFIHNPVAPTIECIDMIHDIEMKYNKKVKYILLATLGIEHKGTVGVFANKFKDSIVYYQPGQYSFPVNLPIELFLPFGKAKEIPNNPEIAPWYDEIDHAVLDPLRPPGSGGFSETAFYHRDTKTLLVTDSIVKVEDEPPLIIQEDPRALLYHARNSMFDVISDTVENRRRGWRRIVLFALAFQPGGIKVNDLSEALKKTKNVTTEMSKLGRGVIPLNEALYPWDWIKDEKPNFKSLQKGLLVAPILQKLIFNREPEKVMLWVNKICRWNFQRIIPCHLSNNIKTNKDEFSRAFGFLYEEKSNNAISLFSSKVSYAKAVEEDAKFLEDVSKQLTANGTLFPEAPRLTKR